MSWFFASVGQSIGASALASVFLDAEIWFQVQPAQVSSEVTRSVATSVLATIAIAASAQTWYKK